MSRGRPRRRAVAVALGLLLVGSQGGRAKAGDDDERSGVLPRRVYECGLLTAPSTSYRREAVPAPAKEDDDRFDPVLPRATDDGTRSVGSVDAVIEAVKAAPPPGAFTHEGERIFAVGPFTIVVDASEDVQRAVAESLAVLSQPAAEVAVVDVVVLGGEVPADAQDPSAAIAGGARVLAVGRSSGFLGTTATSSSGTVEAYVGGYGTVAADKQKNVQPDPRVGVAKSGLAFQASVARSGDHLALDLDGWFGGLITLRSTEIRPKLVVESPQSELTTIRRTERVADGAWSLGRQGAHTIAVRVRVESQPRRVVAGTPLPAPPREEPPERAMTLRSIPVRDLVAGVGSPAWSPTALVPSEYAGVDEADRAEPSPPLPADVLVEMIRSADLRSWVVEGAQIQESGSSFLWVRQDVVRQAFVSDYVRALRARLVRVLRLDATVISIPLVGWSPAAPERLDREHAKVLRRVSLHAAPGTPSTASDGVRRAFVRDYDPVIAEAAVIGNPLVGHVFDGLSVEARAWPTADGLAFGIEASADAAEWKSARDVDTSYGAVQCPRLSMLRFRGQRVVRAGSDTVVATSIEGDRVLLLLLGASWE